MSLEHHKDVTFFLLKSQTCHAREFKNPVGYGERVVYRTCPDELHHLDAAPLALPDGRHVVLVDGAVEGVVAPGVVPAVALEALDGALS